ncbi:MAG TPA: ATP-dependent DNA helicase [Stenomitos sp.]
MAYGHDWLQCVFDRLMPEAGMAVRDEQLAMANYVQAALEQNRHLLAEAGVGTGKTYAYLIPALAHHHEHHRPVLIATHTITLQEQLVQKDLPAVSELIDLPIQAQLAKGREHFLCPERLAAYRKRHAAPSAEEARLYDWADATATGDRAERSGLSEALWRQVNWNDAGPCSRQCRHLDTCPSARVRQSWKTAQGVIVTNHHQFCADLALMGTGSHLFALPGLIILDEAHALFDAARDVLGHRTPLMALQAAVRTAILEAGQGYPQAAAAAAAVEGFFNGLSARVGWEASEEAERFEIRTDPVLGEAALRLYEGARELVEHLGSGPASDARTEAMDHLDRAIGPLLGLIRPEAHVVWAEGNRRTRQVAVLASAPRDLAGLFRNRLFGRGVPVVLTSATLSVDGDFTYFKEQAGLEHPLTCSVGSPFDFERQARLYLADDLPDPSADVDAFYQAATRRLKALLEATHGRALVLYTARTRAEDAVRRLKAWGRYPVLYEERATPELITRFREQTESVLVGTGYWEGLDVPGEALSCVIIVKLPFPAPDPLIAAQEAAARAAGQDPFQTILLPQMLLKLEQGAGRLIRRRSDRGVVALLDPRATSRAYRDQVLASLPPAPQLPDVAAVQAFLRP